LIGEIEGSSSMNRVFLYMLCWLLSSLAIPTVALAGGPDPANYPLRVHVMKFNAQQRETRDSKSDSGLSDYVSGMGVADLFENGEPRGFQFTFSCIGGMKASGGYGTFPARWKKRDKTLEILLPETGKPWNMRACELHAEIMPGLVFYWRKGALAEEAANVLKEWMVKHQYDPEKDMNDPVMAAGELDPAAGDGTGDSQVAEPD
jgi:hypothetical protein